MRPFLSLTLIGILFGSTTVLAQVPISFPLAGTPAVADLTTGVYSVKTQGSCVAGPNTLCLAGGRFGVEATWRAFDNVTGSGNVVPFHSEESGLLWFFDADNWEVLVKVLDGCAFNDHFWVFSAASTNVAYRLRVTDHVAGIAREYSNPFGNSATAITDTSALPTCDATDNFSGLLLFAQPTTVKIFGTSTLSLIARDGAGNPIAGARIGLETTLGRAASEVFTDADGEAETLFSAGRSSGQATITASLAGADPASVRVTILDDGELFVFANPSSFPVFGMTEITVVARDADGIPLRAGERIRLIADQGFIDPEVFTDAQGEARAIFTGALPGVGRVTAIVNRSAPASVEVTILNAPEALSLLANPQVIEPFEDGEEIQLLARVFDSRGLPFPDLPVRFDTLGTLQANPVMTNELGEAETVLLVRAIDVQGIPENGTFTILATATGEGRTVTDSVEITVLGQR